MPFVRLMIKFLCSSIDQTFLASSVGHFASLYRISPIRSVPINSSISPFSIISIILSSRGSTWIQNLLCLLGLLAMAIIPSLGTLSR